MSEESLKEKDIAGKKEDEQEITTEKCAKTEKSPPTNKGMEKSRVISEKYFNVQSATKQISTKVESNENLVEQTAKLTHRRNLHIVEVDCKETAAQSQDLMETSVKSSILNWQVSSIIMALLLLLLIYFFLFVVHIDGSVF